MNLYRLLMISNNLLKSFYLFRDREWVDDEYPCKDRGLGNRHGLDVGHPVGKNRRTRRRSSNHRPSKATKREEGTF